ncbi:hypothetical protein OQA88_10514 [Cercophora sp. LCS_1]
MPHPQDLIHRQSLEDPEAFWGEQAKQLHWHKPPSSALGLTTKTLANGTEHKHWEWFPNGELSTCYNCVDRHVLAGRGSAPAIYYDSPVTNTKLTLTYNDLLEQVSSFAGTLRAHGVKEGDVVLVYMPMIPASLIAILAINRLGAIHAVVFGGFAANALAQRIDASRPVLIITASCGIDGNKPPIPYQPLVSDALSLSSHKPLKTIVYNRPQHRWGPSSSNDLIWQSLPPSPPVDCVPVPSSHPIYIIYTSGTTGLPKGVLRESAGHAVGLMHSITHLFNLTPSSTMGCLSDIGWVVSHSYTLYAPLLLGASTVLYEGKPVGTPSPSAFWRLISDYKITTLFTAPTALRAIRKEDPENTHLLSIAQQGGLRSLRGLFLAGERSEPKIIQMYTALLSEWGHPAGSRVVDNWWSSESGSPISGILLSPSESLPIKPGSAGKPLAGFDVRVVSDKGEEVPPGRMGNIVLALPLAPTAFRTLWDDPERFYKGYLLRFGGKYLDTGDAGFVDTNGYVHIMARSDDIINVAAHRLSTGTLEQAITSHGDVTEACVVSVPDELKGHLPFAFVATAHDDFDEGVLFREIQGLVRSQVGTIATLGGMIRGRGMIPKTRSGKTLRRVLRELLENAVHGDFDKEVSVPSTVEDASVVDVARAEIRKYFEREGRKHAAIEQKAKL